MPSFSAADVKRLRDLTAAGMMDCKRALEESGGDFDKAVEILRVKGAKDVDKRAGRVAANGLVAVSGGAIIELNCETDFVAKNEAFQQLGARIAEQVRSVGTSDLDAVLASTLDDGETVQATIEAQSAVIGEKLQLRRVALLGEPVATYLHRKDPALPPQVGVLVRFTGVDADAARGAAMQVAAMRPRFVVRDEVPAELVADERRIAEESAHAEGKPEQAVPKIVEGRVNAFFKDSVLTEQASVQDPKRSVAQVLADAGVQVTEFVRFEVGAN